jgi:predicted RNA-binding Zn ribbon-like protein
MSPPTQTARFRQGAGRLCLDFARTLRYRGRPGEHEELPDADALAAWVRQFGPAPPEADQAGEAAEPPGSVDPTSVARAQRLREAIHQLIEAARGPTGLPGCPAEARELVNAAAAGPAPAPWLDAHGRMRWRTADPVAATLTLVARDALDLVSSPALGRVRNCADPTCRVLFYDGSRPGSRRWCSMGSCGNRAKKATLRAKS